MTCSAWQASVLCVALLSGSARAADVPVAFTPHNGFDGHSQGNGTLRLFLGKPRLFHVDSRGYDQEDGSFRLDQTVTFQGEKAQTRFWLMKTINKNNYTASLSDASGPVTGSTEGSRLSLRYRVKGPLVMHQTLKLLPDLKTIDNVGKITLLGITVGRLHETIIRQE